MKILKELCSIHAPSGEENQISEYIIDYINKNMNTWKTKPTLYYGKGFQDCIVLCFGVPRTAIYAHMDSIGFTVKYNNEIIKIGLFFHYHSGNLNYNGDMMINVTDYNVMTKLFMLQVLHFLAVNESPRSQ